jgi:hypothetical protein
MSLLHQTIDNEYQESLKRGVLPYFLQTKNIQPSLATTICDLFTCYNAVASKIRHPCVIRVDLRIESLTDQIQPQTWTEGLISPFHETFMKSNKGQWTIHYQYHHQQSPTNIYIVQHDPEIQVIGQYERRLHNQPILVDVLHIQETTTTTTTTTTTSAQNTIETLISIPHSISIHYQYPIKRDTLYDLVEYDMIEIIFRKVSIIKSTTIMSVEWHYIIEQYWQGSNIEQVEQWAATNDINHVKYRMRLECHSILLSHERLSLQQRMMIFISLIHKIQALKASCYIPLPVHVSPSPPPPNIPHQSDLTQYKQETS